MAVKITECPRDAMQGIKTFIPTQDKISYINALLKVGFDTLDFGSFVSPKAVPQMKDTAEVLSQLELSSTSTKLLAIIGNLRGAQEACQHEAIDYLGFPFSISPTFLQRNINSSLEQSYDTVKALLDLGQKHQKNIRVYISMAFGNPYDDPWSIEILLEWIEKLYEVGSRHLALADTTGLGNEESIAAAFHQSITQFPEMNIGIHLHTKAENRFIKINAAYQQGCRHFDGVLNGLGGCPMAGPALVGNISTLDLISFFEQHQEPTGIQPEALKDAKEIATQIIPAQ